MKTIDDEWNDLKANLSFDQQKDGRRCFYCGVVLALEMKALGKLTANQMRLMLAEIELVLRYEDANGK